MDGVATEPTFDSVLANIFYLHYEENWINSCSIEVKITFYRIYVDNIVVLFESPEFVQSLREYMCFKHQNINSAAHEEFR